jgi:hypothetical protein
LHRPHARWNVPFSDLDSRVRRETLRRGSFLVPSRISRKSPIISQFATRSFAPHLRNQVWFACIGNIWTERLLYNLDDVQLPITTRSGRICHWRRMSLIFGACRGLSYRQHLNSRWPPSSISPGLDFDQAELRSSQCKSKNSYWSSARRKHSSAGTIVRHQGRRVDRFDSRLFKPAAPKTL